MKHWKQRWGYLVLSLVLVCSMALPVWAEEASAPESLTGKEAQSMLSSVKDHLILYGRYDTITSESLYRAAMNKLIEENPELYEIALKGMLESLDQYSEYYTAEESEELMISVSGEIVGIGVTIDFSNPEAAWVAGVIPDTPAERAGLQIGDVILSADGVDLRNTKSEIILNRIRGEEGTSVSLQVDRSGTVLEFHIAREKIIGASIAPEIYEQNGKKLMYIGIHGFISNTAEKFREALDLADAQGITNLILDLRNNGGGVLDQAVAMAQNFVPKGKVITTEDHKLTLLNRVYEGTASTSKKYNIVILMNNYTASASEVFTAALHENGLATTIGLISYGKGTIQSINSLTTGGMIKYTSGYYLTPLGNNINGVGLKPDIAIENSYIKTDKSKFQEFAYNKVYNVGDKSEDVRAAKEILTYYNLYQGEINDEFDRDLYYAVYAFQTQTKLYPYGCLDLTTQINLWNYLDIVEKEQDDQLERAFGHFGMSYLNQN